MKKKIYNKKGFFSGIISLLLATASIIIVITKDYNQMNNVKLWKSIVFSILLLFIGTSSLYRSLNYQCTKEDRQNNDEREQLISFKANTTALKITIVSCFIFMLLFMIAFGITKHSSFIGVFIGISLIFNISMISQIAAYVYHDRHN